MVVPVVQVMMEMIIVIVIVMVAVYCADLKSYTFQAYCFSKYIGHLELQFTNDGQSK